MPHHNPDHPIVSNPPDRRDPRSLRQRLEEGSDGKNASILAHFVIQFGEEITETFGNGALARLEALGDLAAAVRTLLEEDRAAETPKGSADNMVISVQGQRDGSVRATASRFGPDPVIIRPHQVLELRPGPIGQVSAFLVRVRPRTIDKPRTRDGVQGTFDEPPVDARQAGGIIHQGDIYGTRGNERSPAAAGSSLGTMAPAAGVASNEPVVGDADRAQDRSEGQPDAPSDVPGRPTNGGKDR